MEEESASRSGNRQEEKKNRHPRVRNRQEEKKNRHPRVRNRHSRAQNRHPGARNRQEEKKNRHPGARNRQEEKKNQHPETRNGMQSKRIPPGLPNHYNAKPIHHNNHALKNLFYPKFNQFTFQPRTNHIDYAIIFNRKSTYVRRIFT